MGLDIKNLIFAIIAGFLGALAVYMIIYDAIASEAMNMSSVYGWGIDLTYYTKLSLTKNYMDILGGILLIYGNIGSHFTSFISGHISEVFSTNFSRGSPTRFLFTVIFPFLSATIFAGLTAKSLKEYIIAAIISSPVFLAFGYGLNSGAGLQYLINSLYVSVVGIAFGFPVGLIINIFASRAFEREEGEKEKEVTIEEDIEGEIEIEDIEL